MDNTIGIVEVVPACDFSRHASLFGIGRRRFAGKPLLEWVVRRVSEAQQLSEVVVLASDDPLGRSLAECSPPDVRLVFSSANDPLGQLADACRQIPCSGVVRMNVAQPFVDPLFVDRLVRAAKEGSCDYAGFACEGRTTTALSARVGVFAEYYSSRLVLDAERRTVGKDRRNLINFAGSNLETYNLKFLAAPVGLDRADLRLAIHDEHDWEDVQMIFDAIGPECLEWKRITNLLNQHPAIRERMAARNRQEQVTS